MKTEERDLARALRRDEGLPIKEIARRVGLFGERLGARHRVVCRAARSFASDESGVQPPTQRLDRDIRLTCHLFADHLETQRKIERHWLDVLSLPDESLLKSVVNVYSRHSKRKRLNMLPYGTARVNVSRTTVVQSIYGAIQEYAGITRPEWLD